MVCKALGSKVIHDVSLFLPDCRAALSGTHRFMKGYDLIPKYPLYVCNKRELQSFPINCRATNWRPGWFLLSGRKTCLPLITSAFSGGRWGHPEADPRREQKWENLQFGARGQTPVTHKRSSSQFIRGIVPIATCDDSSEWAQSWNGPRVPRRRLVSVFCCPRVRWDRHLNPLCPYRANAHSIRVSGSPEVWQVSS